MLELCNSFLDLKDYFRRSIQRLIDHKSTIVPTKKKQIGYNNFAQGILALNIKISAGETVKYQNRLTGRFM
ncbi:MAG: hypothetical protein NZ811_06180, partial [Gammaproteobacteria bacterium]|nr:hypothetical protein [Gammaproteobacteria bacterium]